MQNRRSGKDRRGGAERRQAKKKSWLMCIQLMEKRGGMDQRSGLDRRVDYSSEYHHEALIEISKRGMIKSWDSSKAKMTYLWQTGIKAITFANFQKGKAVQVILNRPGGRLVLPGRVLRMQKLFTEHGFATEMDVQFDRLDDFKRAVINQILWGD